MDEEIPTGIGVEFPCSTATGWKGRVENVFVVIIHVCKSLY